MDGAFIFSTGRRARKGRELAANPEVAVHLESGDDVVILEGAVEELADPMLLACYVEAYEAKYQFRPDPSDLANAVYTLHRRVAFTWLEQDFVESAACWTFPTR
jgi:pyridoxine/pyridoxamine 5'-phosphate oxidase